MTGKSSYRSLNIEEAWEPLYTIHSLDNYKTADEDHVTVVETYCIYYRFAIKVLFEFQDGSSSSGKNVIYMLLLYNEISI